MPEPSRSTVNLRAPNAGASLPSRVRREIVAQVRAPSNRGLLLALAAVTLVLILGGLWSHARVSREMRGAVARELTTLLETEVVALRNWFEEREKLVTRAGRDPNLGLQVQRLGVPAAKVGARAELNALIAPLVARRDFLGFWIVSLEGTVLVSSHQDEEGLRLPARLAAHLGPALRGGAIATPPVMVDLGEGHPEPAILLGGTIFDAARQPIAALVLLERPEKQFTRIIQAGRSGATGSTYAFNADGVVLSHGRFDDLLRQLGLLERDQSSTLTLKLLDPGVNLVAGGVAQPAETRPLTVMAADAIKQRSGFNVDGYRDYRGVPVVGAWTWVHNRGFGVATETEVSEAYRPLAALQAVFAILLILVVALAIISITATALLRRSRELAEEALETVQTLGQYTLGEEIGGGSMGSVFRATHALLRRPTAVKLLREDAGDPNAESRFEREVQLTAQLTHPNTIAVYDYGRTPEGRFYYAMEYIDGIDLQVIVDTHGALPPARAVAILKQIAGSLEEAHAIGLIHRDIKPSNVMLCRRGMVEDVVKVLDFGLAKAMDDIDPDLTSQNKVVGTPRYMSPESIRAEQVDGRADIYSLAALGYFLMAGRSVFEGDTALAVFRGHLDVEPTPVKLMARQFVPETVSAVLQRSLAKDPKSRAPSARAFIDALDACEIVGSWTAEDADEWWARVRAMG